MFGSGRQRVIYCVRTNNQSKEIHKDFLKTVYSKKFTTISLASKEKLKSENCSCKETP